MVFCDFNVTDAVQSSTIINAAYNNNYILNILMSNQNILITYIEISNFATNVITLVVITISIISDVRLQYASLRRKQVKLNLTFLKLVLLICTLGITVTYNT